MLVQIFFDLNNVGRKKSKYQEILNWNNFRVQEMYVKTNFGSKFFFVLQEQVQKNLAPKKLRPPNNCLVKIWSVTAEVFLIWINVSWLNVTLASVDIVPGSEFLDSDHLDNENDFAPRTIPIICHYWP